MRVCYSSLENLKERRKDKKTEQFWLHNPPKNSWQEYQKKWNFKEIDYSEAPSNNGLDLADPAFAYDKKLTKFIRRKSCIITDGKITDVRYED